MVAKLAILKTKIQMNLNVQNVWIQIKIIYMTVNV